MRELRGYSRRQALLVFDAQSGDKSVGDGSLPSEHDKKGPNIDKFDHAFRTAVGLSLLFLHGLARLDFDCMI